MSDGVGRELRITGSMEELSRRRGGILLWEADCVGELVGGLVEFVEGLAGLVGLAGLLVGLAGEEGVGAT